MPKIIQDLIKQYVEAVKKIYGFHIRQIILVCGDINIIKAVYLQHILKGVNDDRLSVHFKKLLRNHRTFHSAAYAAC